MRLTAIVAALPASGAVAAGGEPVRVKGIPVALEWRNSPTSFDGEADSLTPVAGRSTNWVTSPIDGSASASSPLLLFEPADEFVVSARVAIDAPGRWDAGFLMVYGDDGTWAKLALEVSAYQEPTVVTVVTRGVSDDCNSTVAGNAVYLQVARVGGASSSTRRLTAAPGARASFRPAPAPGAARRLRLAVSRRTGSESRLQRHQVREQEDRRRVRGTASGRKERLVTFQPAADVFPSARARPDGTETRPWA